MQMAAVLGVKPRTAATIPPVNAPVPGAGIPTNSITPNFSQIPLFSTMDDACL